ncbi:MAG: class I SAM-dependent methyltransferase [Thermoanaerobaculia bacterium]
MTAFALPTLSKRTRRLREVFGAIHKARSWGSETASGPGSTLERAASFLPDLIALARSLDVSTLLDAPCGDFNWAQPLADSVDLYVGIDIVPALIKDVRRRFSSPKRHFFCRDFTGQRLPAADLILCRDGLVHLSAADIALAIANFQCTGADYLIATTFVGDRDNHDIATGDWRPLNMQRPPFNFPAPLALIDERCHHTGGIYADKRLALWQLKNRAAFYAGTCHDGETALRAPTRKPGGGTR